MYDRVLLAAQARGQDLTEFCTKELHLEKFRTSDDVSFSKALKEEEMLRLEEEMRKELKKHPHQEYTIKHWKNGKYRTVRYRLRPYPKFAALKTNRPDKVGQYLLQVKIYDKHDRLIEVEEKFYTSLKLYKRAVNRTMGMEHIKVKKKGASPSSAAASSVAGTGTTTPAAPSSP